MEVTVNAAEGSLSPVLTGSCDDQTARMTPRPVGRSSCSRGMRAGQGVALSPDGRQVVTAFLDMYAGIWNAETGEQTAVLLGHASFVWSASFSHEGRRVVTAAVDKTARIWDAATHQPIAVLQHENAVVRAVFSRTADTC